jgi:hypothetical protein
MFVISMVACAVVEGIDAPLVWENVRVDGTAIFTVAGEEEESRILIGRSQQSKVNG